jgi:hypothetical protein
MLIKYYHKDIEFFLDSLESKVRAKVDSIIQLLSIREYHLSLPYSRKIESNLYELRVSGLQNIRIFYTFYEDNVVLLLAINKKTQKLKWENLNTCRKRLRSLHS